VCVLCDLRSSLDLSLYF